MRNAKRHTKPCIYYQTNSCPLSSEECDYVHVIASPEQIEELKAPQATLRTKPCKFFLVGVCKDGYWCRFKHPARLSGPSSASSDGTARDEEAGRSSDDDVDVRDVDPAWKMKPDQHPKYRTRPCRNYLLGKCAYGDRCSYLHSAPSLTSSLSLLNSPPTYLPLTPSSTTYIPGTPPPPRVPQPTPISLRSPTFRDVSKSTGINVENSIVSHSSALRTRTPSSSSYGTDEPATPASPGDTSQNYTSNGMPAIPISPLSDFVCTAPTQVIPSPYGLYSPTSPVPMTIVHVPVAIPMYQQTQDNTSRASSVSASRSSRPRSQSQPHVAGGMTSRFSQFKTKPCRFFNESGRCSKGDRCNFIHAGANNTMVSDSSSNEDEREREGQKNVISSSIETVKDGQSTSEKDNNFYKINWRVLGGGVKMSTTEVQRRHSADTSTSRLRRKPAVKDPFNTQRVICAMHPHCPHGSSCSFKHTAESSSAYVPAEQTPSPLELGAPVDLKDRSASLSGRSLFERVPSSSSSKEKNALALTLQSYSLSSAGTATVRPIFVVQGRLGPNEKGEKFDWGDDFENRSPATVKGGHKQLRPAANLELAVPSPPALRARSSPSSPVTASLGLPNTLFPAESP